MIVVEHDDEVLARGGRPHVEPAQPERHSERREQFREAGIRSRASQEMPVVVLGERGEASLACVGRDGPVAPAVGCGFDSVVPSPSWP